MSAETDFTSLHFSPRSSHVKPDIAAPMFSLLPNKRTHMHTSHQTGDTATNGDALIILRVSLA
jgi:hypothetical protein